MAFGISRIFKSTDAGAPQLYFDNNSIISVLKAVLIDGYGDKDPLGWELAFPSTVNKLVVRPSYMGYVRPFLRITPNLSYTYFKDFSIYSSMYDIDNGVEKKPEGVRASFSTNYPTMSAGALINWIIIGDEAGFYLFTYFCGSAYPIYTPVVYFGALNLFDVSNKFNFAWVSGTNASSRACTFGDSAYTTAGLLRNPNLSRSSASIVHGASLRTTTIYKDPPIYGNNKIGGVYLTERVLFSCKDYKGLAGVYPGLRYVYRSNTISIPASSKPNPWIIPTKDNGSELFSLSCLGEGPSYFTDYATGTDSYYPVLISTKIGKGFRNVW